MGGTGRRAVVAGILAVAAVGGCAEERPEAFEDETAGADEEPEGRRPFLETVSSPEGRYLRSWRGEPLYLFLADSAGESTCHDACAVTWPPFIGEGEPTGDEHLRPELLGTAVRPSGRSQVTYGGWPLYHFRGDTVPGAPQGHDRVDSGGEWYLVTPEGEPLGHDGEAAGG